MKSLVTRFHLLLLSVTLAITGVGFFRIPADFAFPAHWTGSTADWQWPRDMALPVAPIMIIVLMAVFFAIGRALTANHYAKVQHILDPALTLALLVIASTQLGLLFTGIGSDLDFVRGTGFWLGAVMVVLGIVLFEAERHTYAGLRLPWPIASDGAWRLAHRAAGLVSGLAGLGLLAAAWFDVGTGILVMGFAGALLAPPLVAGIATLAGRQLYRSRA
ncbi:hypothetical protein WH87_13480 [Devosia epidermidihirudinis]|uniref:DUF1648 domain-containing protein n=1 Tax=Devosia epidermidihirudinis TaxID=1293439 RepID=A0A0F5Q9F5_9HYPH|nr:SdpI family protein [Devosia epidermidihirudinis]KKC36649.1 hypothetical protein WH87_13480 [Devosia epidermidihirudinis]